MTILEEFEKAFLDWRTETIQSGKIVFTDDAVTWAAKWAFERAALRLDQAGYGEAQGYVRDLSKELGESR